jgi:hypothetical protein
MTLDIYTGSTILLFIYIYIYIVVFWLMSYHVNFNKHKKSVNIVNTNHVVLSSYLVERKKFRLIETLLYTKNREI